MTGEGGRSTPVPGQGGSHWGPEGVGLAGRVASRDEGQEVHDAGQNRETRPAAPRHVEAQVLQRCRQRQGDTCTHMTLSQTTRSSQTMRVSKYALLHFGASAAAECRAEHVNAQHR